MDPVITGTYELPTVVYKLLLEFLIFYLSKICIIPKLYMGKNLWYFRIVVKLILREITENQWVNRISVCYWLIAQSHICKTMLASFPGQSHFQFVIACSVLQKFLHQAGNDICFFFVFFFFHLEYLADYI